MKAPHISCSRPLQRAGFPSEKFFAFLLRRPGLQPRHKASAFQRALAPEVRLVFPLISGTWHEMKAPHESSQMKHLHGNWGSDLQVRHKSCLFFTASAAEELLLWSPDRLMKAPQ
jgi:hypothetical protein